MALLRGWGQISHTVGGECKRTEKLVAAVEQWKADGIPVWYIPELDDKPRIEQTALLRWFNLRGQSARVASHKSDKNSEEA